MEALIDQILHLSYQGRVYLLEDIANSLRTDDVVESGFEVAKARAIDQEEDRLVAGADFWAKVETHRQARKG